MKLNIGENFRVYTDEFNWCLEEKRIVSAEKSKTGQPYETWAKAGYFGNPHQLIVNVLYRDLKDSECKSIKELIKHLESAEKRLKIEIDEVVKPK